MTTEPTQIKSDALYKWRELGPLKFHDIQAKSFMPINFTSNFGISSNNGEITGQIEFDEYGETVTGIGR
jgi:hypothetical protein